ncbi:restriction endonuclease subunit S [Sedimentisphaera salicampi]|uniref:restriction endonuclease subunit S n=1 Tax=Sedimentisphaera salicampi TaxID=1941349 RepID=UPI000B9A8E00|nr:restriction endonuclease subunit S [Sedimentisphaera salicampi]OXU13965.1 Type I restriction modification DNA specificity domain protein [Sedimentisphaera salicampi]
MKKKTKQKTTAPEQAENFSLQTSRFSIPRLRFPEFRDKGEWTDKPLGNICEVLNKRRVPITTKDRKPGPYPYYGASGIVDYVDDYIFDERLILVGEDGAKWKAFENTAFVAEGKYWVNNHAHVLRSVELIDTLLECYLVRTDVGLYVTGAAPPKLTLAKLKKIPVPVPLNLAEQKKIAECLSSLDELIEAEGRKLIALRDHKKGLMQKLFPQPGETQPRLRFSEFRDKGEWKNKTLGEVADYENGKAHEQNIDKHGKYIVVNSKFISTEGEAIKYSNSLNLAANKGDILMVLSDVPNGRAIARCFLVDEDDTYTVNQRICKITAKSAVSVLLFYILDRNTYFLAFDDGVKQTNLKKEDVLQCPILLPKDEDEQQRIAECLSALDTQITAQATKIETLKQHKRGLMQQIFPVPEEVEA